MRFLFLLTISLIFSSGQMQAQKIKGVVLDKEDMSSLSFATVKILSMESSSSVYTSDADGRFELKAELDSFYINISYLGYEEKTILVKKRKAESIDLGELSLSPKADQLMEVTVTANPKISTLNKTITYPTISQVQASANGLDLLYNLNLPNLFVDPVTQSVTVSGYNNIIYKINGRIVSLQDILTVKPETILRVEYEESPSTRYANDDAIVVIFYLKDKNTGTDLFTDFLSATSTGFINGNSSIKTVFGNSELGVNYNVNWRDYDNRWGIENETFFFPSETYSLNKNYKKSPIGYTSQNINANYSFISDKNVFSAKFSNILYTGNQASHIEITRKEEDRDNLERHIYIKDEIYSPSLDLFYKYNFDKNKSVELNLVGTYFSSGFHRNLEDVYLNQNNEESTIVNNTDGNKRSLIFEGFYKNSDNLVNYSVGIRGSHSYTENTYEDINTVKLEHLDLYPYGELNGTVNNVIYSIGTGIKIYRIDNRSISKTYYRNLTNLNFFYRKSSNWSLKYNFNYTPSYPSLADLSDVHQRQDTLTILSGNPAIKPSDKISSKVSFNYTYKKLSVNYSVYGNKTFNTIKDDIFYTPDLTSIVIQKKNQPYDSNIGTSLEAIVTDVANIITMRLGGAFDRYNSKGNTYLYNLNTFSWFVSISGRYDKFTLNLSYRKPKMSLYGRYKKQSENFSLINLNYKNKNIVLKTGIYYPFTSGTKYMTERKSDIAPSIMSRYIKDNANMFYIGFTYSFNWGKSVFNIKKQFQNEDYDNGILKPVDY